MGAIVGAVHQVAQKAQPAVTEIRDRIRASPVVHADETGWREDGVNGYVWTFSTPTERYFLRRGRNKEVVDEALGDSFDGVLVSDFYAAYHHYPGLKQRCWVHLLRDIHDLKILYPQDQELARWAAAVHHIYLAAETFDHPQARDRRRVQQGLERKLLDLCRPYLKNPAAVQGKLCRRMEKHIKELFVFVAEPDVPPDNNAAERSLRPLVVSRKISGGTRSETGHRQQDDPGLPLRHLGRPGTGPSIGLPPVARFPSTLNCYTRTIRGWNRRPRVFASAEEIGQLAFAKGGLRADSPPLSFRRKPESTYPQPTGKAL